MVIGGWRYKDNIMSTSTLILDEKITNTQQIGNVIYTDHIIYFQLSGVILLLSMIGAIILTYKKRENLKKQNYFNQISRDRTSSIDVKEVSFNKGVKIDD